MAGAIIKPKIDLHLRDYYSGESSRKIQVREGIPIRLLKRMLAKELSIERKEIHLFDSNGAKMNDDSFLDKYKVKNKNENSIRVRLETGRTVSFVDFKTSQNLMDEFVLQTTQVSDLKKTICEKLDIKKPIILYQDQWELKDNQCVGKHLLDASNFIVFVDDKSDDNNQNQNKPEKSGRFFLSQISTALKDLIKKWK